MGIILFLVDTSASMNQRTFLGTSYLDVAKGAIDTFMKVCTRERGTVNISFLSTAGSAIAVIRACVLFLSV